MDLGTLEKMVRAGKITSEQVLARTPLDKLDETLTLLKRHRDAKEVCGAMMARISTAPLDEFEALKDIYFRHCH